MMASSELLPVTRVSRISVLLCIAWFPWASANASNFPVPLITNFTQSDLEKRKKKTSKERCTSLIFESKSSGSLRHWTKKRDLDELEKLFPAHLQKELTASAPTVTLSSAVTLKKVFFPVISFIGSFHNEAGMGVLICPVC